MYSESLIRRIIDSVGAKRADVRMRDREITVNLPLGNSELVAEGLVAGFRQSLMDGWSALVMLEVNHGEWVRVGEKVDRRSEVIQAEHEQRRGEVAARMRIRLEQEIAKQAREFEAAVEGLFEEKR